MKIFKNTATTEEATKDVSANDELMTTLEAAEFLRLAPQTLHNYRFNQQPPSYIKINRKVLYRRSVLESFVNDCEITLNSKRGA